MCVHEPTKTDLKQGGEITELVGNREVRGKTECR